MKNNGGYQQHAWLKIARTCARPTFTNNRSVPAPWWRFPAHIKAASGVHAEPPVAEILS